MKIKRNPNQEIVDTIREGLKRTGGYCPCRVERTEATRCMCQEFMEFGAWDLNDYLLLRLFG